MPVDFPVLDSKMIPKEKHPANFEITIRGKGNVKVIPVYCPVIFSIRGFKGYKFGIHKTHRVDENGPDYSVTEYTTGMAVVQFYDTIAAARKSAIAKLKQIGFERFIATVQSQKTIKQIKAGE